MYLLYLDESGHVHDPATKFFVLAGFCVFERQTHWLESHIDPIAERFSTTDPGNIEFHGAPMRTGKDEWQGIKPADRVQAVVDILGLLADPRLKLKVFASVIEKSTMATDQIVQRSFENVAREFDRYLTSLYRAKRSNAQRGLVIVDKNSYEEKLQALSRVFKHQGHTNGKLRNFAEVPLFLDSKASRLIQMADLIAYWIFRYFESGDDRGYRLIAPYIHGRKRARTGLIASLTEETHQRLARLSVPTFPFPAPSERTPTSRHRMGCPSRGASALPAVGPTTRPTPSQSPPCPSPPPPAAP
ncbi:DUF3800 domain-containing protein [Cupriavidus cauae]|uniref:DUF3800 domain-containing protein n=1 Tax=Cupriavidus TaxID=106589 RepID=UPI001CF5C8AD|nr:DUF3800 domain-containing protein [Cupriavidus cauae]MCA7084525.1 DUF3800 domain-containing protein [Cupriavidus sp. DB3]UZN48796.1 DUF3800 domain-containing protein [Cupriavidus cauae]